MCKYLCHFLIQRNTYKYDNYYVNFVTFYEYQLLQNDLSESAKGYI